MLAVIENGVYLVAAAGPSCFCDAVVRSGDEHIAVAWEASRGPGAQQTAAVSGVVVVVAAGRRTVAC